MTQGSSAQSTPGRRPPGPRGVPSINSARQDSRKFLVLEEPCAVDLMEALHAEFAEFGVVRVPQLLNAEALKRCRELYDETLLRPREVEGRVFAYWEGTKYYYNEGTGHRGTRGDYQALVEAIPEFGRALAAIWGSEKVWFLDHEVFHKTGAGREGGRFTPYHQDTAIVPFAGRHLANLWIPLEDTPAQNTLEVVRGSHRGPLYMPQGIGLERSDTSKTPMYKKDAEKPKTPPPPPGGKKEDLLFGVPAVQDAPPAPRLPRLPKIQEQRAKWDLRVWPLAQGDVLMLHSGCIHGNAPVSPSFPDRHTLVLRFFGDDCVYTNRVPGVRYPGIQEGDHFSRASKTFFQIYGPNDGQTPPVRALPGALSADPVSARL